MRAQRARQGATERSESPAERADRNFVEMLQGFRVAVTGIQVLFAFLLTVPFSQGFSKISSTSRWIYFVALLGAAAASMFYIAPAVQHRILFRRGMKEALVTRSNTYGVIGTVALMISMTAATLLVVDFLFGGALPLITAGATALLALWLWFASPALAASAARRAADAGQAGDAGDAVEGPDEMAPGTEDADRPGDQSR